MKRSRIQLRRAQTALEFMLLLAIVAAIILVGFRVFIPKSRVSTEKYFNVVGNAITGAPPSALKTR